MATVKDLRKQFEKGIAPNKMVNKILPKDQGSYLFGGKTTEAQATKTPLVVMAKPGNYTMVCDENACYIKVQHGSGDGAVTKTGNEDRMGSGRRGSFGEESNASHRSSRSSSRPSSRSNNYR